MISRQKYINSKTRTKNPNERCFPIEEAPPIKAQASPSNSNQVAVNISNSRIGIKFSDLKVKFDQSPVIANVSGFVPPGKITALLGPTGW